MAGLVSRRAVLPAIFLILSLFSWAAEAKDYPSQGLASAGCNADGAAASADVSRKATGNYRCDHAPGRYTCNYEIKPFERDAPYFIVCGNFVADGTYHNYPPDQSCSVQSPYTGTGPWATGGSARNGSLGCRNGCDGVWQKNADSTMTWSPLGNVCPDDEKKTCDSYGDGYYWNAALKVCEPPEGKCQDGKRPNSLGQCAPEPCPDGMTQQVDGTCKKKDSECPAGQIRSPDGKCLPGEGQCAAGEVRGPDGTCKKDSDDDGEADAPGEEDSFSGGDDCSSPPSCSGSPIMCGQARIQWRIDCNTRKNRNIAGGMCNSMPICTGEKCDALEYSALLMQWRTACAVEKLASASGGGDNADTKAIRDALTGTNGVVTTPADTPASEVWAPKTGTPVKPDTSGYGWGRTCPQPPSIEVFGAVIAINTAPICNWLILGGYFVMGLAALASLRIMATRDA